MHCAFLEGWEVAGFRGRGRGRKLRGLERMGGYRGVGKGEGEGKGKGKGREGRGKGGGGRGIGYRGVGSIRGYDGEERGEDNGDVRKGSERC